LDQQSASHDNNGVQVAADADIANQDSCHQRPAAEDSLDGKEGSPRQAENSGSAFAMSNGDLNGHAADRCCFASKPTIPADEEAFLRSLGWEDCDDENEGMCHGVPAWFCAFFRLVLH
jgi:hypothetical protein